MMPLGVTMLDVGLGAALIGVILLWLLDSKEDAKTLHSTEVWWSDRLKEAKGALKTGEDREAFLTERLSEARKGVGVTCPIHGAQLHCRACLGEQGAKARIVSLTGTKSAKKGIVRKFTPKRK